MRFAYIDSQGNEVAIPSVDALALRVELGAIGPDTELYDAQADRWGPAKSHEIFHSLSRTSGEDDGFVAPPPPAAPAPEPSEEPEDEPAADDADVDFALIDEETESFEPLSEAEPDSDIEDGDAFDFEGMDTLVLEDEPDPAASDEDASLDFGGEMELEPPLSETEPSDDAPDFGGGIELEQPMSEFSSDAPPSWVEQDGPDDDDSTGFGGPLEIEEEEGPAASPSAASRSAASAGDGEGAEASPARDGGDSPPRRTPRSRPSPPRRPKQRSVPGAVLTIVGLAIVVLGSYFGWQAFQTGSGPDETTPALPPVTIPEIPAELLPTMRDVGEVALAATVDELRAMEEEAGLPADPQGDWLAGVYLANASDFPGVREYWTGIGDFVDHVRASDTRVFHQEYQEALSAEGITGDTARILLERADSGFLATRDDRAVAYTRMQDLVSASLDLHDFLLENEAEIAHDPAAGGVSTDPVLEAVPSSRELGDEMWSRVDRITEALDRLGTLDRVTTERLLAVLLDRIRSAGFQ